ncbi:MAG: hypothetical protein WC236_13625 [Gallionellaceae bacterium]|jgi:hypothetical protein
MKSWRKLLASFFCVAGLSLSVAIVLLSQGDPKLEPNIKLAQIGLIIMGVLMVGVSYYLWLGKSWARLILVGLVILGLVALIVLSVLDFFATTRSLSFGLGNVFFYIFILSFPLLFLGLLFHQDVVKDFKESDPC